MEVTVAKDKTSTSWRRWFRRTDVYIAEYILMLTLVASFIGVLVSLWFNFFGMLYTPYASVETAASQIGALLVVGPAAFWMYARVTGQEMVQPELHARKSRTVFLTIWMFFAVLALVGMVAAVVAIFVNALFGLGSDFAGALVTGVIPGLFAVATVVFGLLMVVKRASRKFVMLAAIVLAISAVALLVMNTTMVLVRKDSSIQINYDQSTPRMMHYGEDCTASRYFDQKCSYQEYQDYLESSSGSSSYYNN